MQSKIANDDVLDVLNLWYFKANKRRQNVLPEGSNFVYSDTLGCVRTTVGTVVVSRITTKYHYVFKLFCRWLEENQPKFKRT